jgi:hypothetical protein
MLFRDAIARGLAKCRLFPEQHQFIVDVKYDVFTIGFSAEGIGGPVQTQKKLKGVSCQPGEEGDPRGRKFVIDIVIFFLLFEPAFQSSFVFFCFGVIVYGTGLCRTNNALNLGVRIGIMGEGKWF